MQAMKRGACSFQFFYHLLITNRFQFRNNDFSVVGVVLIIQSLRATKILFVRESMDNHKSISEVSAIDFPSSHV